MDQNPGGVFFLLFIASTTTLTYSKTDHLPAPTKLEYEWLDLIVLKVNWSWKRDPDLPKDCKPAFKVQELNEKKTVTENQTFTQYFLSGKMKSSWLTLSVVAECLNLRSEAANITIFFFNEKKRFAELVRNFKCFEDHPKKCTWIPLDPSQRLKVSYRYLSRSVETLKVCEQQSEEHVCFMNETEPKRNVCVIVETDTHMNTFEPERAVSVPPLNIRENGNSLLLTWTPSDVRNVWEFELWYKECNKPKKSLTSKTTVEIPYDPCCVYHFQYRVQATGVETPVSSSNSSVQTYGSGKCYNAGLVMAIVAPVLVFFCVLLSCYCFRRHKDIICPVVPYPSNLLKELMNGTKDSGNPATLLTQDQEVLSDVSLEQQNLPTERLTGPP